MENEIDDRFSRIEIDDAPPRRKGVMPGDRVKDTITGFEGVVYSRTEHMYGCNRIGIEPTTLKDGKPRDVEYFDEQRVEVLQEGPPFQYPPEKFRQGSRVRDTVSGFEGVVTARTVNMYGHAHVAIQPTTMHEGKPVDVHGIAEERVELVVEQAPPVAAQSTARSGGPQNDRAPTR